MKKLASQYRYLHSGLRLFGRRLWRLISQPVFIALTVFGNLVIASSSLALFKLEYGINKNISSLLDTTWWAVATVTTVGYGDVIPVTPNGKLIGIFTMIIGTALFWSYTALFAEALIANEIGDIELELRALTRTLGKSSHDEVREKSEIQKLIRTLKSELQKFENRDPAQQTQSLRK